MKLGIFVRLKEFVHYISEQVGAYYNVAPIRDLKSEASTIDLIFVDELSYLENFETISVIVDDLQPLFLPIVLLKPKGQALAQKTPFWISEIINIPTQKTELLEKVTNLLYIRKLSIVFGHHPLKLRVLPEYIQSYDYLKYVPIGTLVLDPEGNILFRNKYANELEDYIGKKSIFREVPPNVSNKRKLMLTKCLEEFKLQKTIEEYKGKKHRVTFFPLKVLNGTNIIVLFEDLTDILLSESIAKILNELYLKLPKFLSKNISEYIKYSMEFVSKSLPCIGFIRGRNILEPENDLWALIYHKMKRFEEAQIISIDELNLDSKAKELIDSKYKFLTVVESANKENLALQIDCIFFAQQYPPSYQLELYKHFVYDYNLLINYASASIIERKNIMDTIWKSYYRISKIIDKVRNNLNIISLALNEIQIEHKKRITRSIKELVQFVELIEESYSELEKARKRTDNTEKDVIKHLQENYNNSVDLH